MNHFPLLLNSKQQENLIELSTARQFCVVTLQNDTLIHIIQTAHTKVIRFRSPCLYIFIFVHKYEEYK